MNTLKDFAYERPLVLGLAKSGTAAAKLFLESGLTVRVNDGKGSENDLVVSELRLLGAEVVVGSHPLSVLEDIDIIVKNPGIPYDNPVLVEAEKRNIPIITEIELAGKLTAGSIIGITGSNGKTTTTALCGHMLMKSGVPVKIAGNIGTVATDVARTIEPDMQMVLELSSFQLMGIQQFRPNIAVLLNIYQAHLDYHKTLENYRQAKCNIFKNQTAEDILIYNDDDPVVSEAVKEAPSIKAPFSTKTRLENGAWADDNSIYFMNEKIMDRNEIVLVGEHNVENILAAVSAAKLSGASNEGIREVLKTFSGVPHRLQFIEEINGRQFYNDSKATNILATEKALAAFERPTILLAGGLDRGNGFEALMPSLTHVKAMVTFGETAEKLMETANLAGISTVAQVDSMEEAVQKAYELSADKDIILLSPACASWDQYRTFEERGDMFVQAVHKLK
ncbi:UDP-N-acetylmuramoyl-L-alanine--D-glutamate ligase [Ornithinibacillus gellani]|uniref:UDP-N-acetylmuramoyl-L-alanine--D-glutamate ligase n=1 Tax=Ornithinibacillus gellani TaxID=2293253 RepID=UPI000F4A9957|nr:UDP-N-acetylmuramoyl-L-alanine--D-glutamate ligase [Ornithinibacillus gellani]TQS75651.1 UDP-N-acetylmuramoyl-L-alanine--D-glutamate ligase [Ornithinibacillus gellani]